MYFRNLTLQRMSLYVAKHSTSDSDSNKRKRKRKNSETDEKPAKKFSGQIVTRDNNTDSKSTNNNDLTFQIQPDRWLKI